MTKKEKAFQSLEDAINQCREAGINALAIAEFDVQDEKVGIVQLIANNPMTALEAHLRYMGEDDSFAIRVQQIINEVVEQNEAKQQEKLNSMN